jgi:PKD repeat protein
MKRVLLLLSAVGIAQARCLLFPVSLPERVAESELIVEGYLVRERVVREPGRNMLYTVWELVVTKHFAGELPAERLQVAQEGGVLGTEAVVVTPSAPLQEGVVGLFFLKREPVLEALLGQRVYSLAAGPQGVFVYELEQQRARDPFLQLSVSELSRAVESLTGRRAREYAPLPSRLGNPKQQGARPMATITGFTPTTIPAGAFDTLRILGSGFGTTAGTVRFRNPDDGGSSWVNVPANHIVLWSDAEIRVIVPTQAGTGNFQVITSANETVTSPSAVTIPYALLTISSGGVRYPIRLVNDNGAGGYTLRPNASFAANTVAFAAFVRALQAWRCSTYVNFALSETPTTVRCAANDGVSVVGFDTSTCALPSGVLGATYNYYQSCTQGGQTYWRRGEVDLIFRRSAPGGGWNFGPQPPNSTQYDFESVALHELGHVHLLGHVIAAGQLMHYAIGPGQMVRTMGEQTDKAGGLRMMALSTSSAPCGPGAMVPLTAGTCAVGAPVANFGASPREGCVPLAVNFVDSSSGATSWAWDVDGDGSTDYTVRSFTHIYTQPGQYTVRLIVSNSFGSDTLVRPNYIAAYPVPVADAGPDRAVCPGEPVRLGGSPTAAGGTPPYQYSWEPAQDLDNPSVANPTARLQSSRQYILTVTDARGCQARDTVTLVVRPQPEPRIFYSGRTEFCQGDSLALVAPWGYQRYRWNTGDTNRILVVRQSGAYWVAVQDTFGCWGTSDTVRVTVYPLPQAQILGPASACWGDTVLYRAASPGAGDSFQWSVSGGELLSGQGTSQIRVRWTAADTGRVRMRQQSPQGCQAESEPVTVVVFPLPEPSVTVLGQTAFCQGDSTVLEAPEGYLRYRWNTGDTTRRIVVKQAGTYRVEVVSAAGCRGMSGAVTIQVYPLPPKPEIERRGDTLVCSVEATTYRWYYNGQLIVGATQREFVARLSGRYAVEVVDSNGCRNMSEPLDVVVGIVDQSAGTATCFPNPAEEVLWVELPPEEGRVQLVLSDILGRALWQTVVEGGPRRVAVPLQALPPGVYGLRLRGSVSAFFCPIVKR